MNCWMQFYHLSSTKLNILLTFWISLQCYLSSYLLVNFGAAFHFHFLLPMSLIFSKGEYSHLSNQIRHLLRFAGAVLYIYFFIFFAIRLSSLKNHIMALLLSNPFFSLIFFSFISIFLYLGWYLASKCVPLPSLSYPICSHTPSLARSHFYPYHSFIYTNISKYPPDPGFPVLLHLTISNFQLPNMSSILITNLYAILLAVK